MLGAVLVVIEDGKAVELRWMVLCGRVEVEVDTPLWGEI